MRKLLLICTVAAFALSCNNDSETDTDNIVPDTSQQIVAPVDSSTVNLPPDTTSGNDTLRK